ncbi:cupredoxin domain-containing protein [Candidatus Daviesbacteria bacterium]|nr:cupredoxin domain-containing protein [Candidatus Daviesbacteria bacterium]
MNKNLIIGIFIALVIAGGGWLFFKGQSVSTQPANETIAPITEVPASGNVEESTDSSMTKQVKEFSVTGSSFKFEPAEVKVNKGDTVKITFVNAGGFHDFNIEGYDVKTKQGNGPSEETVTFVASKAGEFPFYCSVGQHRSKGMEGKLIVQ